MFFYINIEVTYESLNKSLQLSYLFFYRKCDLVLYKKHSCITVGLPQILKANEKYI